MLRVHAACTQEKKAGTATFVGCVDDMDTDLKVFVDELRRKSIVRQNSADLGSRRENVLRTLFCEKSPDVLMICQIKLGVGLQYKVFESERSQTSHKRGPNKSTVPGDINFRIVFHR